MVAPIDAEAPICGRFGPLGHSPRTARWCAATLEVIANNVDSVPLPWRNFSPKCAVKWHFPAP